MKLHLPKLLLTAVMAVVCCGASSYGTITDESYTSATINGVTPTTDQTITILKCDDKNDLSAELAGTSDYIVLSKNETSDGNGRYKVKSDVFADAESKVVIGAGNYTNADGTTTSYYGGQLFVEAWGTSGVTIDNDIIIGESKYKEGAGAGLGQYGGALRLHEADPNRKIVLTGNITLVSDAQFSIGGSTSKLNNYLEGYLNAEGETLTLSAYDSHNAGITFAGGANIGTLTGNAPVLFSATKADGTAATSTSYTIGNLTTSAAVTVGSGVSLTIGNWTVEKTLVNNGTLSLTGTITLNSLANLEWSYTGYEDLNSNGEFDLYKTYKLVSGTGTLSGSTTTFSYNGGTYNVADGYSAEAGKGYFVATGTVTVGGDNPTEGTADIDMYYVNSGATLQIAGDPSESKSAANILKTTVGTGNVLLTGDVTMASGDSTQVNGKLTIQNATLTMGGHKNNQVSVSSFDAITLDNGVIEITATTTSFDDVTVTSNGGSLKVKDVPDSRSPHLLTGTTTIQKGGTFTIETSLWRSNVKIESLTGEGNLVVKDTYHSTTAADNTVVNISALQNFTGAITVDGGTDGVTSLIIDSTGETTLSAVTLTGGGTLKMMNKGGARTTNITSLTIEGSATLASERSDSCYNGTFNIGNLTGTGATLTLKNGSQTDAATVFNIDGGSYAGTINLEADSAKGEGTPNRKLHMYVNDATALQSAVINFQDPSTATATDKDYNYITFGVGIDNAKVAGITGTTTNAAVIKSTEGTRNLVINVAENQKYASNAKVENNINLVKTGAGEQAFSSDMSAYTGAVKVSGGKLALTNEAEGANTTLTSLTLDGGALDVTGTLTLSNVTVDLTKYTAGTNIELVTAGTLSADALSVSYANGATTVGNYTGTLAQDGNSLWLTWKDATPTVSSITTSVSTEEGWYTLSPDGTTLTLTVTKSLAGLAADGSVMVDLLTDDQLNAIMSDANYKTPYVLLELTDSDKNTVAADAFDRVVFIKGETGQNYWGEMVGGQLMYNVERIPEPTTATLSLLALMGLAARRRRQK